MRVGINGRPLSVPQPRGSIQSSVALIRALDRHPSVEPVLFGHSSIEDHFDEIDVRSNYFPIRSQFYGLVWEQIVLPDLAASEEVEVLFCPNNNGPLSPIDVPTVVKIHDLLGYLGYMSRYYQLLQQFRMPRIIRAADRIVVPSIHTRREIRRCVDGATTDIELVYNGIAESFLSSDTGSPISLPDQYILYVGGQDRRKNVDRLVQALRIARREFNLDHHLVLIGPESKFIENQTKGIDGSESWIKFHGFVPESELVYAYRNAELFVFPSLYEGFGLPPLEAMACGTPVLASDHQPMPEILGDAPRYIDPEKVEGIAQTIGECLAGDFNTEPMRKRGAARAEQYTWDRAAERMVEAFRQVI